MKLKFNNRTNPDKSSFIGYISDNRHSEGVDSWHDLSSVIAWYHSAHKGDEIETFLDGYLVGISEDGELIKEPED